MDRDVVNKLNISDEIWEGKTINGAKDDLCYIEII